MIRYLVLAIGLLLPTAAHAGPPLCFSVEDGSDYYNFKLVLQSPCALQHPAAAPQGPSVTSVHGVMMSFPGGQPSAAIGLLHGVCTADHEAIGLIAEQVAGNDIVIITSGTSLEEGTVRLGSIRVPVEPVPCGDLEF